MPLRNETGSARRFLPSPGGAAGWALLYVLVLVYSSTIIGPLGINYVPISWTTALHRLLSVTWIDNGSDQRADWMANLVTLVPFGFLVAHAALPHGGAWRRVGAALAAFMVCVAAVLAIKYLQLFFPPRTVTLNYIVAQSAGCLLGILVRLAIRPDAVSHARLPRSMGQRDLVVVLGAYTGLLLAFTLVPFDIALSTQDWQQRLTDLPAMIWGLPGEGRQPAVRLILLCAGTASFIPVGMFLAACRPLRGIQWAALAGLALSILLTALSMAMLSGDPRLISIVYRTAGIAIGAAVLRALPGWRIDRFRRYFPAAALLLALLYLGALLFVNGIATSQWRSFDQALAQVDPRIFLPLFLFYIVLKTKVAASVGVHVLMYAPVGVLVWMRDGEGRGGEGRGRAFVAAGLAALLSFAVEMLRWLKPDLAPDLNEILVAAIAAWLAVRAMDIVWPALARVPGAPDASAPEPAMAAGGGQGRWAQMVREAALPAESRAMPAEPPRRQAARTRSPAAGGTQRPSRWDRFASTGRAEPAAEPTRADAGARLRRFPIVGLAIALVCLALTILGVLRYPLGPLWPALLLLAYGGSLWRWPVIWMVVMPAVLPAVDLAPWTGWMFVGESDLFAMVTIGVLALRSPPRRRDLWPAGWPGLALALAVASVCASIAMAWSWPGLPGGSTNPYLMPENALRVGKALILATALSPFLRARMRRHGDTMRWFATGMLAGLASVSAAVVLERALFVGVTDFSADYRVVASFSSMHIGGGHIGTYLAMAVPFLAALLLRPGLREVVIVVLLAVLAGYAVIVTFARMAFIATVVAAVLLALGWIAASAYRRGAMRPKAALSVVLVAALSVAVLIAAAETGTMAGRFGQVAPDAGDRWENWRDGLAMREDGPVAALFGAGLGSFGRIAAAHKPGATGPTNFVAMREDGADFLRMSMHMPIYFGQKVTISAPGPLRLSFDARAASIPAQVNVFLCRKMLLYSQDCQTASVALAAKWQSFSVTLPTGPLSEPRLAGLVRPPVEFSFSTSRSGPVDITRIALTDSAGRELIANGGFTAGTDRWYFTDDDHLVWRMENQYLMTFVESGALGLCAFLLLMATALRASIQAIRRGDRMGAIFLASLSAYLVSACVNSTGEAQRLMTVLYLIALAALSLHRPVPRESPTGRG